MNERTSSLFSTLQTARRYGPVRLFKHLTGIEKVGKHYSAGGLIFHEDKILLIHWDPPRSSYDFPKGTLEPGESIEAACVREVFEETGYHTRIVAPIDHTNYVFRGHDGRQYDKRVDYFILELTDEPAVEPKREAYETFTNMWVAIDEAYDLLTRKIDKRLFKKALDIRKSLQA